MDREHLKLIRELRRDLHAHPELSLHEEQTVQRLIHFLESHTGLDIVPQDGWFYAVKRGTDPAAGSIAFRADMDALPIDEGQVLPHASQTPGVSHKCGHDGHCAALCGLALELDQTACRRTVYLIFQPAEEIGAGGKLCAQLITEKGIDEIYAFHNLSGYPEGTVVYRKGLTQPASEGLKMMFRGRQSHASAPEEGLNPAQAIAHVILRAGEMSGEPLESMRLCTVTGVQVGTGDFGISPGEGTLCVTLRAEREEDMQAMEKELLSEARNRSDAAGLEMTCEICDRFPGTANSDDGLARVLAAAERLKMPAVEMDRMWRASEDFGYYLKLCSGAMFYIGNGMSHPPLHTVEYDFNDRILEPAVDLFLEISAHTSV